MKPATRSPSYIVRNPYSYCFRLNVPADLQLLVGRTELRYSLRTGCLGEAKEKARVLHSDILLLFRSLRKGCSSMQNMDDDKIQSLVQRYLQEYKDGLEKRYLDEPDHFLGAEDFEQYVNDLDSIEHDKIAELGTGDYRWVERVVDGILEKEGVEGVQKGSEDYIKLCRGILRSQIKGIKYEKKFMREELPEEPAPPKKETPPVALPPPGPSS